MSILAVVLAVACGQGRDDNGVFGTAGSAAEAGAEGGTGPGGSDDPDGGDASGSDGAGEDDPGAIFDLPNGDDGILPGDGCEKVDFLFVIDNSVSMTDEQQNLTGSFPNFIDTIQETVQAQDYHILVTDMDGEDKWGDKFDKCEGKCAGEPPDKTCVMGTLGIIECGDLPNPGPTLCDQTLGSGRTYDLQVPPQYCSIDGDKRFMSETQSDLGDTFACVASMGAWGGGEFAASAMLAATTPELNGPGGCNEGFLRDDAILVVTIITDEEDFEDSPGDPASWRTDLLAAKGNNETAVVVLSLVGDTGEPGAVCPIDSVPGSTGAEFSPRLRELASSFGDRGVIGSVCADDYGPFFEEAVAVIDSACDEYEPEG